MAKVSKKRIQDLFHNTRYRGTGVSCVYCGHNKLYSIEDGKRYKCYGCQKKFRDWTMTGLDGCRLPKETVHAILSDFCDGVSALQVSKKHQLSYQTVFDLFNRIREYLPKVTLPKGEEESFRLFALSYLSLYRGIQKNHKGYERELKWRFVTSDWKLSKKVQTLMDRLLEVKE